MTQIYHSGFYPDENSAGVIGTTVPSLTEDRVTDLVGVVGYLTNEAHTVLADSAGTIVGGELTNAGGAFKVMRGLIDVTTSAAFTVAASSGVSVSIGASTGVYVINSMSANSGIATLRATYDGIIIDQVYSISKARAGATGSTGSAGADAKALIVIADRQTIAYDGTGAATPSSQTTTFTAQKQNTTATVTWSVTDSNNVARTPTTTYLSSATGNSVTMTEAQFASARNGTSGVIITGTLTDGSVLTDKISVVRVASGATGSTGATGTAGATGSTGSAGADAKALIVIADRQTIAYDGTGAATPSSQTTTFTAQKQNTTATVTWSVTDSNNVTRVPTTTYLSAATGNSVTMTEAQFASARNGTSGVIITGTLTDGSVLTDKISVVRVASGTTGAAGADAKALIVIADRQTIAYDGTGAATPSSQTTTFTAQKQNTTATVTWSVTDSNNLARTPTTTYLSSATGNSVTMTEAQFASARNGTSGVIITGTLTDGSVLTDKISVVRVASGATGSTGADAKALIVIADRQTIAYDGTGAATPSSQTTTFTAQKQNTTATVTWSVTDSNNVARTPTTTYLSSATGNSVTMTEAQFASARNGTSGVIITGTLTDGSVLTDKISVVRVASGATGSTGAAGTAGATGSTGATGSAGADAKALIVIADRQTIAYDGTGAATPSSQTTTFTAQKQNTTATVTWSVTDSNNVARTPVATYLSSSTGDSVTMTEAQFASARNGTSGVIITGTLTDGSVLTDKISVVRVASGAAGSTGSAGAAGADAKALIVIADRQTIAYDGTGAATPSTQTTTFTAQKQNTTATVTWSVTDSSNLARTPTTTYLSSATGNSVTMTEDQFASARNGTSGVIITGTLTDGSVLTDKISVVRVASGAVGSTGADAKALIVIADRQTIAYDGTGAATPSSQTTTFTAQKQNTTATVTWSVTDSNNVTRVPTTTYLSAATGNSVTMTEAQFASARNGTSGVIITGTLTDGSVLTDKISVVRVGDGAVGPRGSNGNMNPNSDFSEWSSTLPTGFSAWTGVNMTLSKVVGINGKPNAIRTISAGTGNCGILADNITGASPGGEYMVLIADFKLVSGNLTGSGIALEARSAGASIINTNYSFATVADASGSVRGAGVVGSNYRYSILVDARASGVTNYNLTGVTRLSSFSPVGSVTIDWYELGLRRATPEEIAAGFGFGPDDFLIRPTPSTTITPFSYDALAGRLSLNEVSANQIEATATIKIGTGDNTVILDGKSSSDKRIAVGNAVADSAPFWVSKVGKMRATDWELYDASGALMLSKNGPTDAFKLSILASAANSLPTSPSIVGSISGVTSTTSVPIENKVTARLGDDSAVVIGVSWNLFGAYGANYSSFANTALINVMQRYSSDGITWGAWSSVGSQTFTKISSGTPTSTQIRVIENTYNYEEYDAELNTYVTISDTYAYVDAGTPATFNIPVNDKVAGYYEFCVSEAPVFGGSSPYRFSPITLTLTDTDNIPSFILNNTASSGSVPYTNPAGSFRKLKIISTSSYTGDVTAAYVIVSTPEGLTRTIGELSTSFSVSAASGSLGRLVSGAVAANTWYYVWAVSNGSTDGVVVSTSATDPAMPGYRYKALIGAFSTNDSGIIRPFMQHDQRVRYTSSSNEDLLISSGSTGNINTPTWTSFSVTAFFPTSITSEVTLQCANQGGTVIVAPNNTYGGYNSMTNPAPYSTSINNFAGEVSFFLEGTTIHHASNDSRVRVSARGFVLTI